MAQLPDLRSFGQGAVERPIPESQRGVSGYDPGIQARAAQGLGQTVGAISDDLARQEEDLARQNAALAEKRYQNEIDERLQELNEKVMAGEYQTWDSVASEYGKIAVEARVRNLQGIAPKFQQTLNLSFDGTDIDRRGQLRNLLRRGLQSQQQANIISYLDEQSKRALVPGADIDELSRESEFFIRQTAPRAGLDAASAQTAIIKQRNDLYENDFLRRQTADWDDIEGLKRQQKLLETVDSDYIQNLRPEFRLDQLNKNLARQDTLVRAQQAELQRLETRADSIVKDFSDRVSRGIPIPDEEWAQNRELFSGLGREEQLSHLRRAESGVQDVLRASIPEQDAFVQRQETLLLQQGGSAEDRQNFEHLKSAVEANKKRLTDDPQGWAETRTYLPVPELKLDGLGTPAGEADIAATLRERAVTVEALRQQQGVAVPYYLLRPEEVKRINDGLNAQTVPDQLKSLESLSRASGDFQQFQRVVNQISPENPVRANAALLAGIGTLPGDSPWYQWWGEPERIQARDVAERILIGDAALNPHALPGETKPSVAKLPAESLTESLNTIFSDYVGNAFGGNRQAYENARQTFLAYYAGRSIQKIGHADKYDDNIAKEALARVIGPVVEGNDDRQVVIPWGMTEDQFKDATDKTFKRAVREQNLTEDQINHWEDAGLLGVGLNKYAVTVGDQLMVAPNGTPVVLDLNVPPDQSTTGLISNVLPIFPYGRAPARGEESLEKTSASPLRPEGSPVPRQIARPAGTERRVVPFGPLDASTRVIIKRSAPVQQTALVEAPNIEPITHLPEKTAALYTDELSRTFQQFGIDTPLRQAHFLAQVLQETGGLTAFTEKASGERYENSAGLGNVKKGDGKKFKGRGAIHLTGRDNYEGFKNFSGVDVVSNPDKLTTPELAFQSAGWYWNSRGLNDLADRDDVEAITKAVQGAGASQESIAARRKWLEKAKSLLGIMQ